MVSKASDDLPEPLRPVITVRVLRGIWTLMFFRLCWRAPRTVMLLIPMDNCWLDSRSAVRLASIQSRKVKYGRVLRATTREPQFQPDALLWKVRERGNAILLTYLSCQQRETSTRGRVALSERSEE